MMIEQIERRIAAEYERGGYGLGWRLLSSPVACLEASSIAFVGLNPGGSAQDPAHGVLAPNFGSAYVTEIWSGYPAGQSPLQRQVQGLFRALGHEPEQVLAGNLVPFRSPSWDALPNKHRAIAFGKTLWGELMESAKPNVVVTMGGQVFDAIATLLGISMAERVDSGWGNVGIRRGEIRGKLLVGLPHLSRYALFGRPKSEAALKAAFGCHWKGF